MSENEKAPDFDFDFQNKVGDLGEMEEKLRGEAEVRLRKLAKGNTDVIGGSIILEHDVRGSRTPFLFRARVTAFTRPDVASAEEIADTPLAALKGALDAVERQVREKREKLRERWKNS